MNLAIIEYIHTVGELGSEIVLRHAQEKQRMTRKKESKAMLIRINQKSRKCECHKQEIKDTKAAFLIYLLPYTIEYTLDNFTIEKFPQLQK